MLAARSNSLKVMKEVYVEDLFQGRVSRSGFKTDRCGVLHLHAYGGKRRIKGIPRLAYGALPIIDEAAKIALLISYEGNYVWFFPSGAIAFRFMDEYDLDFKDLVKIVEKIKSSCQKG